MPVSLHKEGYDFEADDTAQSAQLNENYCYFETKHPLFLMLISGSCSSLNNIHLLLND